MFSTSRMTFMAIFFGLSTAICGAEEKGVKQMGKAEKRSDRELPKDCRELVKSNTQFALDLYRELNEKETGNLVVAPYSISTVLAMTYAGAEGETAKEIQKVLHFPLPHDRLHPAFAGVHERLTAHGSGETEDSLSLANSLWGDKRVAWKKNFQATLDANYKGGLLSVDFKQPEDAVRRINNWVDDRTQHRINELLRKGDVTNETELVLVNALRFSSRWHNQFDEANTEPSGFRGPGKEERKVLLMKRFEYYGYRETEDCKVLELPYRHGRSMIVLLPKKDDGLSKLEKSLTVDKLFELTKQFTDRPKVKVAMARFRIDSRIDLRGALRGMGIKKAFDNSAEFHGMADGKLCIGNALNQTFIAVNEKGTEAGGVTAITMTLSHVDQPKEFITDHPFLFLIRDNDTESILFLGRFTTPNDITEEELEAIKKSKSKKLMPHR